MVLLTQQQTRKRKYCSLIKAMDEIHAINIDREQQESFPYQDQEQDNDAILATIQCNTESYGQRNVLGKKIHRSPNMRRNKNDLFTGEFI